MSYMGLFWETGMPEAWALSRKSDDRPEADPSGEGRLDPGTMALLWSQNIQGAGSYPAIPGQAVAVPLDVAGRPAPKSDDEKAKRFE